MSAIATRYVLSEPPEVGPAPALHYAGGNLGMTDGPVIIHIVTPIGEIDATLEYALRHIDHFAEPGRTRILLVLPFHFDIPEVDL